LKSTSSWYASVVSAALAYHLGGFVLFVTKVPGYAGWSQLSESLYVDSLQALAFVALGAICRMLSSSVLRSRTPASRVVLGDICVVLLAAVGVAAIALPLDASGAGLFSILVILFWGLPATAVLSAFSLLVERYRWLRILLTVTLVLNAALLLVGLAYQLTA
jgi:hypothetical protein